VSKTALVYALVDAKTRNFIPALRLFDFNSKGSGYLFSTLFALALLSSCKEKTPVQSTDNQAITSDTTSGQAALPQGAPMTSYAVQALAGRTDCSEFNKLLNDPTLNFFLQNHPEFDFVFFVFPDASLSSVPRKLLDSVRLAEYSDTKFEFFANHVSMVSKGFPYAEGRSFNQLPLKVQDTKLIFNNNKSVKILEKIPSHERIQIYLIESPIQP
jgi:hypothetical protein